MVEAKHEFIDDNPYLVYSSDTEATASGSGGTNIVYVTADPETSYPSMSAEEICESAKAGNLVIFRAINGENNINDYQLTHAEYGDNSVAFFTLIQIMPDVGVTGETIVVRTKTDTIINVNYPSNNG